MGTPVSGPGPYSKRTDTAVSNANTTLPNAKYGEAKAYEEQRTGAPMAEAPKGAPPMNLQQMFAGMGQDVVPLNAPSTQPDVPVTDGAAMGPGAGLEALGAPPPDPADERTKMYMPVFEWLANREGSSDAARNLIRQLKATQM